MRAEPTSDEGSPVPLLPAGSRGGSSGGHQQSEGRGVHSDDLGCISRVASERQVRAMCADILRFDREYPIVGLTCRTRGYTPALSPERVREVIWPDVPIYVIEQREARTAHELLPDRLAAYNGAGRVWWPGVDEETEPSWHPLIYDSTGTYGEEAITRIAGEFAVQPHDTIDLSPREQVALRLRSVPRLGLLVSGAPADAPLVMLAARKDLRRLTSDLRRVDRDYPIVVLTFGEGEKEPGFSLSAIRSALNPRVPIYLLGTFDLCRRLAQALGPRLAVDSGNARIFWPGVSRDSDPADHPLVAVGASSDRDPADRLISALELSRPNVKGHVALTQQRLQTTEHQLAENVRQLRRSRAESDAVLARAEAAEASLATAEQQLVALKLAGLDEVELEMVASMDSDARMHRLISREWITALQAADRREYPLGGYILGSQFIASVEDRRIVTLLARVAFACAMVACGRAGELSGLESHSWREGKMSGSGEDPQAVRADGGKAWMCNLGHGRGAPRLIYWVLPDGQTEFEAVRNHDAIGRL